MNALASAIAAARRRRAAIVLAIAAPVLLALAALGAWTALVVALAAAAFTMHRALRALDDATLARRLDRARPDLDDSAELLFRERGSLGAVAALQRDRLVARLDAAPRADLREPWPRGPIAGAAVLALAIAVGAHVAQGPREIATTTHVPTTHVPTTIAPTATHIDRVELEIVPPAYTRLPATTRASLDAKVPAGSRLRWRLHLDAGAATVALAFHDGATLALARDGGDWIAARTVDAPLLYRVAITGAPPLAGATAHTLETIDDRAPELRVLEPDKTLSLVAKDQKRWALRAEASDDYALGAASLELTLAQGTGENVKFTRQTVALAGEGEPRLRRYTHEVDLAALGVAAGDDVIARFVVADARAPEPNVARSPSYILRWPADTQAESSGVEGIVQTALPAVFRSQRQIIIDTQALIAERPKLVADKVLARSDSIAVDQKVLRLRYGRFLGEAFESHTGAGGHDDDEGRAPAKASPFGAENDVAREFGHVHDEAEAATLLDPETKRVLKLALEQMWQAELQLRLGNPEQALRPEERALEYVKIVQQANRIYLARVGAELPAPDAARRLSGERTGLTDRSSTRNTIASEDAAIERLWNSLNARGAPDDTGLDDWLRAHQTSAADSLALLAALERLASDPGCEECRAEARRRAWPLLPRPAAATATRAKPDAAGASYLDALSR